MPLIAFEGIDRSGKETQARLLTSWLGSRAQMVGFPRYDGPIGDLIGANLRRHDDELSAGFLQLLMASDRCHYIATIAQAIPARFFILDRYKLSGLAYGMADELPYEWCRDIDRLIPDPEMTFLIDLPVEVAMRRREAADGYEASRDFQEWVAENYLHLSLVVPNVYVLDGTQPPEEIHREVVGYFVDRFPGAAVPLARTA